MPQLLYAAALKLHGDDKPVSLDAVLMAMASYEFRRAAVGRASEPAACVSGRRQRFTGKLREHVTWHQRPPDRRSSGDVRWWGSITSILFNIGGFFGVYTFSRVTQRIGRKPAFAISFVVAGWPRPRPSCS